MATSVEMSEKIMAVARDIVDVNPSIKDTPVLLPVKYLAVLPGRIRGFHNMFEERGLRDEAEVTVAYRPASVERSYEEGGIDLPGDVFWGPDKWIKDLFGRYKLVPFGEESLTTVRLLSLDPKGWGDQYTDPRISLWLRRDIRSGEIRPYVQMIRSLDHTPEAVAARRDSNASLSPSIGPGLELASGDDLNAFEFILQKVQNP